MKAKLAAWAVLPSPLMTHLLNRDLDNAHLRHRLHIGRNRIAILLRQLRGGAPGVVVSGCLGPRQDGYVVDAVCPLVTKVHHEVRVRAGKDYQIDVGKKLVVKAGDEISFQTGKASIVLKKNGDIVIKGKKITVKGSGDIVMKGSKITQN